MVSFAGPGEMPHDLQIRVANRAIFMQTESYLTLSRYSHWMRRKAFVAAGDSLRRAGSQDQNEFSMIRELFYSAPDDAFRAVLRFI